MKHLIATTAAVLSLAQPVLAQETTEEAAAPSAATVMARVNGTEITLGEMIVMRAQLPQQYQQLPPQVLFDGILEQLIQQQLLSDTLEEVPARVGYALANEERSLRAGEIISALNAIEISEDEIAAEYEAVFGNMEAAIEYNASHILVDTEEEALAIIDEIADGTDFSLLARQKSTGPSGPNGGELGWFGAGRMVPEFEAAVMELEIGEVSAPVQTQFGWHVITLNDTREEGRPELEEVRSGLLSQIQERTLVARLDELTAVAEIETPGSGMTDPELLTNFDLLDE